MDRRKDQLKRQRVDLDALVEFISCLRDDYDYNIGAFKYIAAQDLVVSLTAGGENAANAVLLRGLLRPLLCSSREEQDHFNSHFDEWADRIIRDARVIDLSPAVDEEAEEISTTTAEDDAFDKAGEEAKSFLRGRRIFRFLAAAGLIAGLLFASLVLLQDTDTVVTVNVNEDGARVFVVLDEAAVESGADAAFRRDHETKEVDPEEDHHHADPDAVEIDIGLTPLAPFTLPRGKHHISVQKEGFVHAELDIDAEQYSAPLNVELRRVAAQTEVTPPGQRVTLTIYNQVVGARLLLTSGSKGQSMVLINASGDVEEWRAEVPEGVFTLEVQHPACELPLIRANARPFSNQPILVKKSDCPPPVPVTVIAEMSDKNASAYWITRIPIKVGDLSVGATDSLGTLTFEVSPGPHTLSLHRPGYEPDSVRIDAVAGVPLVLHIPLESRSQPVDSRPLWKRPPGDRVAFDDSGKRLAVEDSSGSIRVIELGQDSLSAVFSAEELRLTQNAHDEGTGSEFSWGIARPMQPIEQAHAWNVRSLAFDNSGRRLISGGWDGAIHLWDLSELFGLSRFPDPDDTPGYEGPFETTIRYESARLNPRARDMIVQVAFSPTSLRAVYTLTNGETSILTRGRFDLFGVDAPVVRGNSEAYSVAWHPDGSSFASGNSLGYVTLSSAPKRGQDTRFLAHVGAVTGLSFHPDGTRLATSGGDGLVNIWDLSGDAPVLKRTLTGHRRYVETVHYSPTGTFLASAGQDNVIRIWRSDTGAQAAVLRGHTERITSLAFSPDGSQIASGSWDSTVRIWSTISMEEIASLPGHVGHVWSVAWSPIGSIVASGGRDGTIRFWNVDEIRDQRTPKWYQKALQNVAIEPDQRYVVVADRSGDLVIWDAISQTPIDTLTGHTAPVSGISYSADGRYMASGAADSTLKLWSGFVRMDHGVPIKSARYDPSGRKILTVDERGFVRLWDGFTGEQIFLSQNARWTDARFTRGGDGFIAWNRWRIGRFERFETLMINKYFGDSWREVDFRSTITEVNLRSEQVVESPDKRYLLFYDLGDSGGLLFFDLESGRRVGPPYQPSFGAGETTSISFSPEGGRVLIQGYTAFEAYSIADSSQIGDVFHDTPECTVKVFFSEDGEKTAFDTCTEVLLYFGLSDTPLRYQADGRIADIAFSGDGERMILSTVWTSAQNTGAIALVDVSNPDSVRLLKVMRHTDGTLGAAFSPTEDKIVSWGDFKVYLWSTDTGKSLMPPILPVGDDDQPAGIREAFISRSGKRLVLWDRLDGVHVWNLESIPPTPLYDGELIHGSKIVGVELNRVDSHGISWDDTGEFKIWNANTGEVINRWDSFESPSLIDATFNEDGTKIFTLHYDYTQRMWSSSTGQVIGRPFYSPDFPPSTDQSQWLSWSEKGVLVSGNGSSVDIGRHNDVIAGAVLSPDGNRIVSIGRDSTLYLWDTHRRVRLDSLRLAKQPTGVTFSSDNDQLAVVFADHTVQIWNTEYGRNATIFMWLTGGGWLIMMLIGGVMYGGYWVSNRWALRRARQFMAKEKQRGTAPTRFEAPDFMHEALFPTQVLRELARRMRARIETVSRVLHVERTVFATVGRAGIFTPIFGQRNEIPEYLVLIERSSFRDQQTQYFENILRRLESDEVFIDQYYFVQKPDVLFSATGREKPLTLAALANKSRHDRLIIIGSAGCLFSDLSGERMDWFDRLLSWKDRTLITPDHPDHWDYREADLLSDFVVLPGNVDGFSRLAKPLQNYLAGFATGRSPCPLLPIFENNTRRWTRNDLIGPDDVPRLMKALDRYLDPDEMLWMCACAMYPEMDWKITLNLGYGLRGRDGLRLLESTRLLRLCQLPWFRQSTMPDWLRDILQRRLTPQQAVQVRAILGTLILNPSTDLEDPLDAVILARELDVAQENAESISHMSAALVRSHAAGVSQRHPLKDKLLLGFLAGEHPDPLHTRLARLMEKLVRPHDPQRDKQFAGSGVVRVNRAFMGASLAVAIAFAFFWTSIPKSSSPPSKWMSVENTSAMVPATTRTWTPRTDSLESLPSEISIFTESSNSSSVFINDEWAGATPLVTQLMPGIYRIHVERDGFSGPDTTITVLTRFVQPDQHRLLFREPSIEDRKVVTEPPADQ